MTRYELLKFLHVAGAIAWVGGGLGLLVLNRRLVTAGDHTVLLALGRYSKALGNRLFMPASLLTIAAGLALVATEARFGFTDLWILIGFGGIAASGVAQMAISERAGRRFTDAVAEHGTDSAEAAAAARHVSLGSTIDVVVLLVVVWAMVAKPTL